MTDGDVTILEAPGQGSKEWDSTYCNMMLPKNETKSFLDDDHMHE